MAQLSVNELKNLYTAYNLYTNWGSMSAAQKVQAITSLGLMGFKFTNGNDFANQYLIKPTSSGVGLTYGQAFNLFGSGVNIYALAQNWNQLSTVQKVSGGVNTASSIVQTAKNLNLLGSGYGGAVNGVANASTVSQLGWNAAPAYGTGAVMAPTGSTIPQGYTSVPSDVEGYSVAVPNGNTASSGGAISNGAGGTNYLGLANQGLGMVAGGLNVYQGVKQGGVSGYGQAGIGAAQMYNAYSGGQLGGQYIGYAQEALGAYNDLYGKNQVPDQYKMSALQGHIGMAIADYWTAGGASAAKSLMDQTSIGQKWNKFAMNFDRHWNIVSILGKNIFGGKSEDQGIRDKLREPLVNNGFLDKDYQFTLHDGSKFDFGADGGAKFTTHDGKELNVQAIDESNPNAWYAESLAGPILDMLYGGNKDLSSKMGAYFVNALMSGKGANQDTIRQNALEMYKKLGLDQQQAVQLIQQMAKDGKIDQHMADVYTHSISNTFNPGQTPTPKTNPTTPEQATTAPVQPGAQNPSGPKLQIQGPTPNVHVPGSRADQLQGANGGSQMQAGLVNILRTNPYLGGALVAHSAYQNAYHPTENQQKAVDLLQKAMGFEGDQVTLANGTPVSLKEQPSEINTQHPLDYFAGLGAISFAELIANGKDPAVTQAASKLANAMLQNTGSGKDFTPENFNTLRDNLRAMYAKAGINSPTDAYRLANVMYAGHRLNDIDLVRMHQAIDMVYGPNGYDIAAHLFPSRGRGLEIAQQDAGLPSGQTVAMSGNPDPNRLPGRKPAVGIDPGRMPSQLTGTPRPLPGSQAPGAVQGFGGNAEPNLDTGTKMPVTGFGSNAEPNLDTGTKMSPMGGMFADKANAINKNQQRYGTNYLGIQS